MLISNPDSRCNWENLFIKFNIFKNNENYDSGMDINSSEIFKTDNNINYNKNVSNSVLIPSRKYSNSVTQSININTINGSITECDDYKIISRSAPNNLGESYMEHYIKAKTKNNNNNNMQILGSSPQNNTPLLNSYLNKSFGAFKNMFGYK